MIFFIVLQLENSGTQKSTGLQQHIKPEKNTTYFVPSLKLTAKAPENGWLEHDPFLLAFGPIFRGKLAVSFMGGYFFFWCFTQVFSRIPLFWKSLMYEPPQINLIAGKANYPDISGSKSQNI